MFHMNVCTIGIYLFSTIQRQVNLHDIRSHLEPLVEKNGSD